MRKILIFICFIIATLVVFGMFISATTYIQLAVAVVAYPLLVYFAFVIFPRKNFSRTSHASIATLEPSLAAQKTGSEKTEGIGITDIDKRVFLKLIGAAGLSLFFFSIINRKVEGLLFRGAQPPVSGKLALEDLDGKKINPAQNQPTDGYRISEVDDSNIGFFGFINPAGAWYVMKQDAETGAFRYVRGTSDFPGNWANREKLKYDYFSNVFRNVS
jgi:hypothetical protein